MSEPVQDDAARLLRQAGHLRTLFDHLPAMAAYWDRDARNVLANEAYVEWFGFSPQDMVGRHIREVLGERVYALNLPYITGALAGERQDFDRTLVDTTGRTRHTQAAYVPEIVDGEVQGFFVLVTDVTAKVEAERSLEEAQLLAGVASWSWIPGNEFATWSPQLFRLAGEDPDTFQPTVEKGLALVHPEDRERVRSSLEQTMAVPDDVELRYRIQRRDGEVRHIVSRRRVDRDAAGRVLRLRGTMLDETAIATTNAELVRSNQLLSDTMGMLGHDIRQPLAIVLGYLEQLRWGIGEVPDDVLRGQVDKTYSAARGIRRLLDDVMSMAHADSGELEPHLLDLDVDDLVRDLEDEFEDRGTALLARAADAEPGLRVRADPFHLRQALVNLVVNATRYGAPPYELSVRRIGDRVELAVLDAGDGVPEALLPRLFERFVRGENQSARSAGSTGFGLYLVRRLVEADGGSVTYARRPTGGACFTVSLPAVD